METPVELPYAYDALEPHIDAATMQVHYEKHYHGYVNTFNRTIQGTPWEALTAVEALKRLAELPEQIRETVRNHASGSVNHAFFWQILSPQPQEPSDWLRNALSQAFGSLDAFKDLFLSTALKRFGSGWAWLVWTKNAELAVYSTPNQDNPILLGDTPLLGVDVWEHAYYLKYQNRRKDYLEAFWQVINWREVEKRLREARGE